MKLNRYIIVALAVVCALPAIAFGQPASNTLYYLVKITGPRGDEGTRSMTIKDTNFVWTFNYQGVKIRVIKNKDGAFMISNKHSAGKYAAGSNRERPATFLPGPLGNVKDFIADNNAKLTGTEKVNGKKCNVFTYKGKPDGDTRMLWVDAKTMAPVKLMFLGSKPNHTRTVVYKAYKLGIPVSDSLFVLPKELTVRPMPERPTKTNITAPAKANGKDSALAK